MPFPQDQEQPKPVGQLRLIGGGDSSPKPVGQLRPINPDWHQEAGNVARGAGVDPDLFNRLIQQESGYNPKAQSPKGALGLGQLMPNTAKRLGVDPNDPEQNLQGSAREFGRLMQKYNGDYNKALAAYNAGEEATDTGRADKYPETQQYVQRITQGYSPKPVGQLRPIGPHPGQSKIEQAAGGKQPFSEPLERSLEAANKEFVQPYEKVAEAGGVVGRHWALAPFRKEGEAVSSAQERHPIGTGIAAGLGELAGSTLSDVRNWPFFAAGAARPMLQRLIAGGFGVQMGKGSYEQAKNLYTNWDQLNANQRSEGITQLIASLGMTGLAVHEGVKGSPKGMVAPETGELGTEGGPGPITRAGQTGAGQNNVGSTISGRSETTALSPSEPTVGTVTPKPSKSVDEIMAMKERIKAARQAAIAPQNIQPPEMAKPVTTPLAPEPAQPFHPEEKAQLEKVAGKPLSEGDAALQRKQQAEWESNKALAAGKVDTTPKETAGLRDKGVRGPETMTPQEVASKFNLQYTGNMGASVGMGVHIFKAPDGGTVALKGDQMTPQFITDKLAQRAKEIKPEELSPMLREEVKTFQPPEVPKESSSGAVAARPAPQPKPVSETTRQAMDRQMTKRSRASIRPPEEKMPPPAAPGSSLDEYNKRALARLVAEGKVSKEEAYGRPAAAPETKAPTTPKPAAEPVPAAGGAGQEPVRTAGESVPAKVAAAKPSQPNTPVVQARAREILRRGKASNMVEAVRMARKELEGQKGFISPGGRPRTKGQKKAASEAKKAKDALSRGSLHSGLADLTNAVSHLPEGKLDQRIKDARALVGPGAKKLGPIREGLANLSTNFGVLKDWYKNGSKTGLRIGDALRGNTDPKIAFKKIMGDWDRTNQEADYDLYKWVKNMQKAHTPEIRDAITVYQDTGGDLSLLTQKANDPKVPSKLRMAAKLATQLTPEELKTAKAVGAYTKAIGEELMNLGALNHMVENYMPHLYEADHQYAKGVLSELNAGIFDTRFKYAYKRVFGNYFEAAEKGKVPKNLGADYLLTAYDRTARQAISARAAIKEMYSEDAQDNRPLLAPSWDSMRAITPEEYENHPVIKQLLAKNPKLRAETAEGFILQQRGGPSGQVLPVQVMKSLGIPFDDKVALAGEKARMSMEGYEAVSHWAFKKHIFVGDGPNGKPIFYQAELYAHPSIAKDLRNLYEKSQFRENGLTKAALKVTSGSKKLLLSWLPSGFHYTQEGWHAVGHNINPFKPDIWSGKSVENAIKGSGPVREGLRHGLMLFDFNGSEIFGEGIGDLFGMKDHLFQKFVPGLKAELYPKQFQKNMNTYTKKGYSEDQIHEMTARQVNSAFGMQDEIFSGRSKFMQDLFRLTALAPDFLESRARFIGQAGRPGGKEQRLALLRQGLYMYGAARLLNAYTNEGDAKWEPSDAFTWHVRGQKVTIRSVLTDAWFAASDLGGFISTRGALIPRAFAESYHQMRQPPYLKTKGSAVEAAIRGQAPIMLQGFASGMWRKYAEGRENEPVALDTFRSIVEGMFGTRLTNEPKEKLTTAKPPVPKRPKRY